MTEKIYPCPGCGGLMDISEIEPFTLCECSDCKTEIVIPMEMDFLTLEKPVGKMSFFDVYEGFDRAQGNSVIISILNKDIPDYEEYSNFARDDAVALSTLMHPNLCPLHHGSINDKFFVTFPKMDGYPLSAYAPDSQGLLDVDSVIDVLQAVALGLAVSHHKEFIHHNLCPENIHIDARGNVRVINYFISRFVYECDQRKDENDFTISVSPYFISPEKLESRIEDKRGDVFSFGVIFYYMLSGKYPFMGKSEIEILYRRVRKKHTDPQQVYNKEKERIMVPETIQYVPPVPPHEIRDDIPVDISKLIMNMISYYPVKRPTFTEILTALNLLRAKEDQKQVKMAQKEMVATKTRAIPIMKSLSGSKAPEKKKKKKGFFR